MTASVRLDYFYGSDVKTGTFFRIPKAFETHAVYSAASVDAKYLYGVMLDRVGISARNGWLDEGRVFIIFTIEAVQKCIHVGKNKASQVLHELEKLGLIQRVMKGQGKPARIFLKNIVEEKQESAQNNEEESAATDATENEASSSPAQNEKQESSAPVSDFTREVAPSVRVADVPETASAVRVDDEPETVPSVRFDNLPFPTTLTDSARTFGVESALNSPEETVTTGSGTGGGSLDTPDEAVMTAFETAGDPLDAPKEDVKTPDFGTSRGLKSGSPDSPKQGANKNNRNKNYSNNINLSPPTPSRSGITLRPMTREEMEEDRRECREFVLENIEYDRLVQKYPFDVKRIDGYVGLLTETLCDERPYIRIGQREFGVNEVRERLLQINYEHICYVHECMRNTSTKIINMRAYTLTALFNAPLTVDQYYDNLAAHDLAEDAGSEGDYGVYSGYGGYRHGRYRYGRRAG